MLEITFLKNVNKTFLKYNVTLNVYHHFGSHFTLGMTDIIFSTLYSLLLDSMIA